MGCSSCGGKGPVIPGGRAENAIVLGADNGEHPQYATFLVDHSGVKATDVKWVTGDGVQQAVDDGIIARGYVRVGRPGRVKKAPEALPEFYVAIGNGRYKPFVSRRAAEKFGKSAGRPVLTHAEIVGGR